MTDSPDSAATTSDDPSGEAASPQLGEDANAVSTADSPATDQVPGDQVPGDQVPGNQGLVDDESQNAPLPDWGPTDGEHGVDEPAQ